MNLQYWAGQPGSDQTSAATGGVDLVFQAVVSFFTACNPFWLRFAVLGPTLNPTRQFLLRFSWTTVCASVILVLVRIRPMPAANEPELIRFVRDMTLRWPCRRAGGQPCSCRQGIGSRWWRHAGRGGRACCPQYYHTPVAGCRQNVTQRNTCRSVKISPRGRAGTEFFGAQICGSASLAISSARRRARSDRSPSARLVEEHHKAAIAYSRAARALAQ